jgi:DNA repair photolyase
MMRLNVSKGNMYDFVTHTWNTVKGACPHNCAYCYMRRFGEQKPAHFDAKELKTDLGKGNYIFVGSSCDMWAEALNPKYLNDTLDYCRKFDNKYLFQSKNPIYMVYFQDRLPPQSVLCTTIETNRPYPLIRCQAPTPFRRAEGLELLKSFRRFVTIEPIIDFDLLPLVELIKRCEPEQVNIGADSGGNGLPEPSAGQVLALIGEIGKFTKVKVKNNLSRIIR